MDLEKEKKCNIQIYNTIEAIYFQWLIEGTQYSWGEIPKNDLVGYASRLGEIFKEQIENMQE